MKILIVGSNAVWAIENYYSKYLKLSGDETSIFNCSDYYNPRLLLNRILYRLRIRILYRRVNAGLLHVCEMQRPDIVWIFKGVEIFATTLKQLKTKGIILVNYNPDHPFIRTTLSHGGIEIEKAISLYDAHFCYSEDLKHRLESEFHLKAYMLPFGYEPTAVHLKEGIESKDVLKVCMIGYADRTRAELITTLLQEGIPVDVYGTHWHRFLQPSALCNIYPSVYGDQYWQTLLDYRVQLNVFRPHNEGSHNMRTFEIPSVGGIQLAPYSHEQAKFFEEDKEIWLYQTPKDMVQKAKKLLEMTSADISAFRLAARDKCIKEDYTYRHRSSQVHEAFNQLMINN